MSGSERSWRGRSVGGRRFGRGLAGVLALAGGLVSGRAGLGEEGFVTEDFEDQELGAFPAGWSDLADVVSPQEEVLAVVREVPGPDGEPTRALEVTSRHGVSQGIYRRVQSDQGTYRITLDAIVVADMNRGVDNIPLEISFAKRLPGDPYFAWQTSGADGSPNLWTVYVWSPIEQQRVGTGVVVGRWYRVSVTLDTASGLIAAEVRDVQGGFVHASGSAVLAGLVGDSFDAVYVGNQHRGDAGPEAITLIDNMVYSDPAEGYFPEASCALVDPPEECYRVGQTVQLDGTASTTPEGSEIVSWDWDFGDETTAEGATASHAYQRCGRYEVSLLVTNDKGGTDIAKSTVCIAAPTADPAALAPWTATQVGTPALPGGVSPVGPAEPGCYAFCAGGRGMIARSDECLLLGQPVEGDGTISVSVAHLDGGAVGAGVGVTLRESLEPDAAFVALCAETRSGGTFQYALYYRLVAGGQRISGGTADVDDPTVFPPGWVRLRRTVIGDVSEVVGEVSDDGTAWTIVGNPVTVSGLDAPVAGAVAYARVASTTLRFTGLEARVCALEWSPAPPGGPAFRRGDSNCDGSEDLSDATATFNHLFLGGAAPCCLRAADVNRDDALDISDGVALLNFLFLGGEAPAQPFGACGRDDDATLGCERYPPCP